MYARSYRIAPLLFFSGFCALVYQVAWERNLRLIFGGSTAASAAVVAVFIAGLGLGGLVLGRRVERHPSPLMLYSNLEASVATVAALTPGTLWLARRVYLALGGTQGLGVVGGTLLRLALAALVLGIPTFLMGGTLPAAARAAQSQSDPERKSVALLYGLNTFGAVCGCLTSTFLLLEVFGNQVTLWMACLINALVAIVARMVARALPKEPEAADEHRPQGEVSDERRSPVAWVLVCSGVVGFAFFLMELVWYRMLGPILGGSVFTFGLILAVALLGIALGSSFYSRRANARPATMSAFATTCVLEAACIALPYALGDRIAVLAVLTRPLGAVGFIGYIAGWVTIAALVVGPAAFVSGVQFPLLIGLLGKGREGVGMHVAWAYASNTLGAIAGALAGGFGLMVLLSAPGTWKLATIVLIVLALASVAISAWKERRWPALLLPVALAAVSVLLLFAQGPTAAWRHSPIGVGRVEASGLNNPNAVEQWLRAQRGQIAWEVDGKESSVAVNRSRSLSFVVNGKIDGNSRADAGTQVMGGMVGALIHPSMRKALVIGLGTGSTAGWLGKVPGATVDVVELEPAILRVASECAPVNHSVLSNPNVHVTVGDAREVLLASSSRYDLIFSEPSNPYRAGIASLFTREYYEAAKARLESGGLFLQWVQAYEVDPQTLRTIYATLQSVFPQVETWELRSDDLLLVASEKPVIHDVGRVKERLGSEPYHSAAIVSWRVSDVEGIYGHYVASPGLAKAVSRAQRDLLNTDDQMVVEFGFGRALGVTQSFDAKQVAQASQNRGVDRPTIQSGGLDWQRFLERRATSGIVDGRTPDIPSTLGVEAMARVRAQTAYTLEGPVTALRRWQEQKQEPATPLELELVAEGLADAGQEDALRYIEQVRAFQPTEALVFQAILRLRQDRLDDAARLVEAALVSYRTDAWPMPSVMVRALQLPEALAAKAPDSAPRMFAALQMPFAAWGEEHYRRYAVLGVARHMPDPAVCMEVMKLFEPHVPWDRSMLTYREQCYRAHGTARQKAEASADLFEFLSHEPGDFAGALN